MNRIISVFLVGFIVCTSCGEDDEMMQPTDPCANMVCLNGGTCENGLCDCPSGYSGSECETYTPVEVRLQTETPLEIVESGISPDSLYGKFYRGGYIFYLDVNDIIADKEGLVCAPENLTASYGWGCEGEDSPAVNVTADPVYPVETAEGGRPGDGVANTLALANAACGSGSAAAACDGYATNDYDDWFLPSRGALFLMYFNLESKGHDINFDDWTYWSSTEKNEDEAWVVRFSGGSPSAVGKGSMVKIRAVRAF